MKCLSKKLESTTFRNSFDNDLLLQNVFFHYFQGERRARATALRDAAVRECQSLDRTAGTRSALQKWKVIRSFMRSRWEVSSKWNYEEWHSNLLFLPPCRSVLEILAGRVAVAKS